MVDISTASGGRRFRPRPIMDLNHRLKPFYIRKGKRLLDMVIALPLMVAFAPLIAILLAIVSLDGSNPLFGQVRIGRGGRPFRCWKIRSMVPDAPARLAELLERDPEAAAEWAEHQKLTDDPRVTRIGNLLRRTSLDELPQLWNVLRGDMSLVGPRPVPKAELERYGRHSVVYESLSPGLTGPWQAKARNQVSYDERVRMDVAYARNLSLLGDLYLILLTGLAVVRLTGK